MVLLVYKNMWGIGVPERKTDRKEEKQVLWSKMFQQRVSCVIFIMDELDVP